MSASPLVARRTRAQRTMMDKQHRRTGPMNLILQSHPGRRTVRRDVNAVHLLIVSAAPGNWAESHSAVSDIGCLAGSGGPSLVWTNAGASRQAIDSCCRGVTRSTLSGGPGDLGLAP